MKSTSQNSSPSFSNQPDASESAEQTSTPASSEMEPLGVPIQESEKSQPADQKSPQMNKNKGKNSPKPESTPFARASSSSQPKEPAHASKNSGASGSKALQVGIPIVAVLLAGGAIACSILMWQRMTQLEQQLQANNQNQQNILNAAQTSAQQSQTMAQQSFEAANALNEKVAYNSTQIHALAESSKRTEMLLQYINTSKAEELPVNIRSVIFSALLQSELTGSVSPMLLALKSLDQRLAEEGMDGQSPLRLALLRDIENIRNSPVPDPLRISIQIDSMLTILSQEHLLPLVIDLPPTLNQPETQENDPAQEVITTTAQAENAATSEAQEESGIWSTVKNGWRWTANTAGELGDAAWTQVSGLIRITPLQNGDAALLAPEQGMMLRENIRLQLLSVRISVLQRQYPRAQKDLIEIQRVMLTYFDSTDPNVQNFVKRLQRLQEVLQNNAMPQPTATLSVLASLENKQ